MRGCTWYGGISKGVERFEAIVVDECVEVIEACQLLTPGQRGTRLHPGVALYFSPVKNGSVDCPRLQ